MADPFEALDGNILGSAPMPLQPATTATQSSGPPQPVWPGLNAPAGGGAAASTNSQQYQQSYTSFGGSFLPGHGGGGGFHPQQQLQPNTMIQGNTPAPHPLSTHPSVASSTGHAMIYQQQQRPMVATAAETPWNGGGMLASTTTGPLRTATHNTAVPNIGGWNPNAVLHAQQATTPSSASTAAAAASPQFSLQMNTSAVKISGGGAVGGAGAAEWTPAADQMASYEEMWTTASAGCEVSGTVSGRAAVQFFSRSGLPKDSLKMVREDCV